MVTKYDLFEMAHENAISIKPIEIIKKLGKTKKEYNNIHRLLVQLEKDKLLIKTSLGFNIRNTEKSKLLHDIIDYCLDNNINYNFLLDPNLVGFISEALHKKEISLKDARINSRTFVKYIQQLEKYGLLLILSKKPLRIRMFYNSLINNLLFYFDFKEIIVKKFSVDYLNEVNKELVLYKRLRKKNERGFKNIVEDFEISFVHHSLALEGNPITLPETVKILKDNVVPKDLKLLDVSEVKNYQSVILQMLKDGGGGKLLTIQTVLDYHKIAMQHRPGIAGKIRDVGVYIKGNPYFKVSKVEDIKSRLKELFFKYEDFIKQKNLSLKKIFEFAVFFHNEFQQIHPFVDGNSRITRLVTFYLLQSKGIPILDIPFGLLEEYLDYTKGAKKRDDKKLNETLQKTVLYNLKRINEGLK